MNKKISKLVIGGMVLMLCAVPLAAANQHGMDGGKHGWGKKDDLKAKFFHKTHFLLEHADELGLDEPKQEQIKDLKYKVKKELIRTDADIEVLKIDIDRLLMVHAIDVAAVNQLVDQKYELKKNRTKFLVQSLADLKLMLSEDQYKTMKELYKQKKMS